MKKYTDEELLNAARMIKEHCRSRGAGHSCCFAIDGICTTEACCGIAAYRTTPADDWKIPKFRKWTAEDVAMAKVCVKLGYTVVGRSALFSDPRPFVRKGTGDTWYLDAGLFLAVKDGCAVVLSDIIEEAKE